LINHLGLRYFFASYRIYLLFEYSLDYFTSSAHLGARGPPRPEGLVAVNRARVLTASLSEGKSRALETILVVTSGDLTGDLTGAAKKLVVAGDGARTRSQRSGDTILDVLRLDLVGVLGDLTTDLLDTANTGEQDLLDGCDALAPDLIVP
jgi:hypothetical protein